MKMILRMAVIGLITLTVACREVSAISPAIGGDNVTVSSQADVAFPKLTGRVVDVAELLTPEEEQALSRKSQGLEAAMQHQFVVVTVPSLQGQDIATFTRDLGRHWGIGRKDHNDGVILLVAPTERQVRIAVGYGLERTLTPTQCSKIIREHILPWFKHGDYPAGIADGVDALVAELR